MKVKPKDIVYTYNCTRFRLINILITPTARDSKINAFYDRQDSVIILSSWAGKVEF